MTTRPGHRRPLKRRTARCRARPHHAWDIETTNIAAGTPDPRYVSLAHDVDHVNGWACIGREAFHAVLVREFLTDAYAGHRFVAHNANRFDNYQVVLALLDDPHYYVEPWLTRAQDMRGLAVYDAARPSRVWYFSDSMAMLAFPGSLAELVHTFAPDYEKLQVIDWEVTVFNPTNAEHIAYALHDSRILQAALDRAAEIVRDLTGVPLQNTIGKLGILFWQRFLPPDVLIWQAPPGCLTLLRQALRGGLVYCREAFRGQAWQYDINQSYTHQQRNPLPCGRCSQTWEYDATRLGIYECVIQRMAGTPLPFYCLDCTTDTMVQTDGSLPVQTVILSPEIELLRRLDWSVTVTHGWTWTDSFTMSELANQLETARATCEGGPKGPIGTMIKAIGNNAFGKTLEQVDGMRYRFSSIQPGSAFHHYAAEIPATDTLWCALEDTEPADYQKLQIGVFILAYGRIQLYEQIARHGADVLYSDTDCLITRRDITDSLDIHPSRYGAWKIEQTGQYVFVLNKKAYAWPARSAGRVKHWKGLHTREISYAAYERAYTHGEVPAQPQLQRRGIMRVVCGLPMFGELTRHGSAVLRSGP